MEGAAARLTGDHALARRRLEEGERLAGAFGTVTIRAMCLAQLASVAVAEESWSLGASLARQAAAEVRSEGLADIATLAPVFTISALTLAHQGEVESARRGDPAREAPARRRRHPGRAVVRRRGPPQPRAREPAPRRRGRGPDAPVEARRAAATAADLGSLNDVLEELTAMADGFSAGGEDGPSALTTAEVRLLHFLPTHLTFAEIGERVHLSRNTVKTQAVSVYRKLDVSSRSDAVERATELGLLEP